MIFKNTVITLVLAGFMALPALAAKKRFTCEQTTDASGNIIYLPVKKVAKAHVKHRRVAKVQHKRVYREETKVVSAAPVVEPAPAPVVTQPVVSEPVYREKTAAERRREWLDRHTPSAPIYGNMSGWAGTSMVSVLHGTDNPWGKQALNNDIGPSAGRYKNTANENSRDEF
ncbi:MAG: hypothetical protein ACXVBE_07660 [Bdellovibrionota bacterium]